MFTPPHFLRFFGALALLFCAGCQPVALTGEAAKPAPSDAAAPPAEQAAPLHQARKLCELDDANIDESSGLGASRRYAGALWTHNDSGDEARLFLVNTAGKTIATVQLQGEQAEDWEDMAVAGSGAAAWVYAADIGDNDFVRPEVVIYRFREPKLDARKLGQNLTVPCERMILRYPDGAHDAETLIATAEGRLVIVTKTLGPSLIFQTPQPWRAGARQTLTRIGQHQFGGSDFSSRLTTGGDLSPDGRRLVVRTYTQAHEWILPQEQPWTSVWKLAPRVGTLPKCKQGESICYSADGKHFFVSSEKLPSPLYEVTPLSP